MYRIRSNLLSCISCRRRRSCISCNPLKRQKPFINPTGKQVTICLLHSCQIDPPPRPSLRLWSSSVGPLTLRSDRSSLTHFVTCLPVGLIIIAQLARLFLASENTHELIGLKLSNKLLDFFFYVDAIGASKGMESKKN